MSDSEPAVPSHETVPSPNSVPSPETVPLPKTVPPLAPRSVGVIVVAAGSGSRLGNARRKAFARVSDRSILEHCLDAVFETSDLTQVVVVAPAEDLAEALTLCEASAGVAASALRVVAGGQTRQASVTAGLGALNADIDTVLVHDAARAFTPVDQFDRVSSAVTATGGGVVPVLVVTDTIKKTDASGRVVSTLDRRELVVAQTPQGFPRAELDRAYAAATTEETDDAALFAAAGGTVTTVAGDAVAFKITTPWDLRRAEQVAASHRIAGGAARAPLSVRVDVRSGLGIDVHAFDSASELWLGGLFWPGETGLSGHSDGDAVSHAICDALLSAAGLGDVGGNFGTDDPRFAGAHGTVFLTETISRVRAAGYEVGNVAVQIVAKHPKISPRRLEMEALLTALIGAPVSLSATTTDGLGFTGRGDGIAAIATALIRNEGPR